MPHNIQISINNTKDSLSKIVSIGSGNSGSPLILLAQPKALYSILDSQTGFAPQNILIKRDGQNLTIAFKKNSKPDIIIEDFYGQESAGLVGMAEDREYYYYIPETGEKSNFIPNLSSESQAVWSALGPVDGLTDASFPWGWVGGLLGAGALAAIGGGSSDKNDNVDPQKPSFIVSSDAKSVDEDNSTPVSGQITVTITDSTTAGSTQAQNNSVGAHGTFSIDSNGSWTYTLNSMDADVQALGENQTKVETFVVKSSDGSASNTVTVTITGSDDKAVLSIDPNAATTNKWYENILNQVVNTDDSASNPIKHSLSTLGIIITDIDGASSNGYTITISESTTGWLLDTNGNKVTGSISFSFNSQSTLNLELSKCYYQPNDLSFLSDGHIPDVPFTITLLDNGNTSSLNTTRTINEYADNINITSPSSHSYTGDGDDTILVKASATDGAFISSGEGSDKMRLQAVGSIAFGGEGNDVIWGDSTSLEIDGGNGNDTIYVLERAQAENILGNLGADIFAFSANVSDTSDNTSVIKDFDLTKDKLNFFDVIDTNHDGSINLNDVVASVHYDAVNSLTDIGLIDANGNGSSAHIYLSDVQINSIVELQAYIVDTAFNSYLNFPSF